jgi:hypothetical protein
VTEPLVRQLDHVIVPVADPRPLFDLFATELGLPVAWPVMDKGLFTSGAVCAGNANIEFLTGPPSVSSFFEPTEPLAFREVAFEPRDAARMIEMLDERALPHSKPLPYADIGGEWTNVFVSPIPPESVLVFLCHYHGATAEERRSVRRAFHNGDGGPLGVKRAAEVTLGVADLDSAMDAWTRFLAPAEPDAHGAFHVGDGPAIRLRRSPIDGVAAVWLEVVSLAAARDALRERDLLGPMRASGIGLNYARTGGLDVWLTEKR